MSALRPNKAVLLFFMGLGGLPLSTVQAINLGNSGCPAGMVENDLDAVPLSNGNFAVPGTLAGSEYTRNPSDNTYPAGPSDSVYTFMTGQFSSVPNFIDQNPFPGDSIRNLGAINSWLYVNGKLEQTPGSGVYQDKVVWQDSVTVTPSTHYAFSFYISNAVQGGNPGGYVIRPVVSITANGQTVVPRQEVPYEASGIDAWTYYGGAFSTGAAQSSVVLRLIDHAEGSQGDDFAITGLRLIRCTGDESGIDTDGDGLNNAQDLDDDNDGIPDAVEGLMDSDGDGVPNYIDLDSDNDGIPDLWEAGLNHRQLDANEDGRIDGNLIGSNGIIDIIETSPDSGAVNYGDATPSTAPRDNDGDGVPDYLDLDSDNDTLTDLWECVDPALVRTVDASGTGRLSATGVDANGVHPDSCIDPRDSEGDGTPDYLDTDSDNDGLRDVIEVGSTDANGDGRVDGFADLDGDGLDDRYDGNPPVNRLIDTDGDTFVDVIDALNGPGTGITPGNNGSGGGTGSGLYTGIEGVGGSIGSAVLALLFGLAWVRRRG